MQTYIQVTTTVEKRDDAEKLARTILEQRLAACVQIAPCTSLYWWQEAIEKAGEYVCSMKTRTDLFPALEQLLAREHPYDVPEILALPITGVSAAYAAWLEQELARPTTPV